MDLLRISAIGSAGLSALKPPPPPAPATSQTSSGLAATQDLVQGLAQELFRQSLQTAAGASVAESARAGSGPLQVATASLLAALNAPQSAAPVTPVAGATLTPAAVQASTTAPTAATPATLPTELPATQDAFQTGSSLDFALQTALRFGAGVAPLGNPLLQTQSLGTGLVRDAAAVPRLGSLQPRAGGPGPEAFAQAQASGRQALSVYQTAPATREAGALDLLA